MLGGESAMYAMLKWKLTRQCGLLALSRTWSKRTLKNEVVLSSNALFYVCMYEMQFHACIEYVIIFYNILMQKFAGVVTNFWVIFWLQPTLFRERDESAKIIQEF